MRIVCEVNDMTVRQACNIVEKNALNDDFRQYFQDVTFNYSVFQGVEIFDQTKLNLLPTIIIVRPYRTINPFSKVIGYAKDDLIYVNTRKLYLPLIDRIENIMHECFHIAGFSHDGNRVTPFNLKTVPYYGASLFIKYLKDKKII